MWPMPSVATWRIRPLRNERHQMTQTIGIIGYGRFGAALTELFDEARIPVVIYTQTDPERPAPPQAQQVADLQTLCQRARILIPAVPIAALSEVITDLRPHLTADHLLIDVASIKEPPTAILEAQLGKDIPWVSTHPLFGPASITREERPLVVVVCPNTHHPEAASHAADLFARIDCEIVTQDAATHDKHMAATHALAFFIAKAFLEIGVDLDGGPHPPSFAAMATTIRTVQVDAGHLFGTIASDNPHAAQARTRLLDALTRIHRELADPTNDTLNPANRSPLTIPAPATTPPELHATRELIDDLDRDLLSLLARRARLARRAARLKHAQGRTVQDPNRESELLDARRTWAADHDLQHDAIADIFEAILRFSRAEQKRYLDGA